MYPLFKRKQDARELKLINSIVKPGFNVLDIGANIGFYTKILSNLVGNNGNVFSFEPEGINFKYLQQNLRGNKNVTLINKAVADKTGPLKIYLSKMLNVDHRTYPVDNYESIMEINATSIDDYLALNNRTRVDFIKMDIQGFEMAAFKGMEKTLDNNPDVKIITELWPYGLKKAGSSVSEIIDFANLKKFNIYLVTPKRLELLYKELVLKLKEDEKSYCNVVLSKEIFEF